MTTDVWSGSQGTLCVYVSKAKDLPNLTKLDKQNVMLRLRIAHMTRESNILFRAGQNPVFNYLEKYTITPEVKPIMQVEAYCDRKKKPPLIIGRCEVDLLNGIRADPKEGYCSWYELKRERSEFAGTIFIELTFTPNLPHLQRQERNRDVDAMYASIMSRPVPRLPGDPEPREPRAELRSNPEPYMHGSAIREITPAAGGSRPFLPELTHSTFSSSISGEALPALNSSVDTSTSEKTNATEVTTTSDTKFHFANLKKLKEKINVFKNPNNSATNQQSETPVDIEALQKAIGVVWLDDEEEYASRTASIQTPESELDDAGRHPSLPPLPSSVSSRSHSEKHSPRRTHLAQRRFDSSDMGSMEYVSPDHRHDTPRLPPLPKSQPRNKSRSPGRRPPPVM